jgi:hypothetical protein
MLNRPEYPKGKKGARLRSGRHGEPILLLLLFHHLRRFGLASYTHRATCAGAVHRGSIIRQDQTRFWLHTGIVLVLPNNNLDSLEVRYKMAEPARALQEAIRFARGDQLGPRAASYDHKPGDPQDPKALELQFAKRRGVEEHEFLWDAASFAADLASIDGALVLLKDLTIVGFGAHIVCAGPANVPTRAAQDPEAKEFGKSPMGNLGTRHNSTARFCYSRPGALGLVVSQDGVVSALLRDPEQEAVTLWRPVALEWHW